MHLDQRETLVIAILVLFLGKYLNARLAFLRRFTIPDPVTGGIFASVAFGILHFVFGLDLSFTDRYRDILLVIFFTAIGLETDLESIVKGGRVLALLAVLAVIYLFVQSGVGILLARLFGIDPNLGLLAGSASLQGGHGNVAAWAPILSRDYGVSGGMEIGMTMATFGLILGGVLGGPVAKHLIQRHGLETSGDPHVNVGRKSGEILVIDYDSALKVLLMLTLSVGMGIQINELAARLGFSMPLFVPCMFSGVVLANLVPRLVPGLKCPPSSPTLALSSELSLGLFLAMAMMGLRFWEIGGHALFLVVNLTIQVALILLFSTLILFRVLGRNYDAVVIAAGYVGSALGATPTAMANMAAVTQSYGASRVAFLVIPVVAAFITQATNSVAIQAILNLINR